MRESARSMLAHWLPVAGIGGATLLLAAMVEFQPPREGIACPLAQEATGAFATCPTRVDGLVVQRKTARRPGGEAHPDVFSSAARAQGPLLPAPMADPSRTEFRSAAHESAPVNRSKPSSPPESAALSSEETESSWTDAATAAEKDDPSSQREESSPSTEEDLEAPRAELETARSAGQESTEEAEEEITKDDASDAVDLPEPPREIDAAAALRSVLRVAGNMVVPDGEPALGVIPVEGEMRRVWLVRTRATDGALDRDFLVDAVSAEVLLAIERTLASSAVGDPTSMGTIEVARTSDSQLFAAAADGEQIVTEGTYTTSSKYFAHVTRNDGELPDPLAPGLHVVREHHYDFYAPRALGVINDRLVDVSRDLRIVTGINQKPGLNADALYFGVLSRIIRYDQPFGSAIAMSAGVNIWTARDRQSLFSRMLDPNVIQAHRNMGRVVDIWDRVYGRKGVDGSTTPADVYIGVGGLIKGRPNMFAISNGWFVFGRPDGRFRVSTTSLESVAAAYAHAVIDRQRGPSMAYDQSAAVRIHMAHAFAVFTSFHARTDGRQAEHENEDDTKLWQLAESDFAEVPSGFDLEAFARPEVPHVDRFTPRGDPVRNAGILNQALYLLVHGGTNPVSEMRLDGLVSLFSGDQGRAFSLVERAYYRLFTSEDPAIRLHWSSGYRDFRDQFLAALLVEFDAQFAQVGEEQRTQIRDLVELEARFAFHAVGLD